MNSLSIITTDVKIPDNISVKPEYNQNFIDYANNVNSLLSEVRKILNDISYYLSYITPLLPVLIKDGSDLKYQIYVCNASWNGNEWHLLNNDISAWGMKMNVIQNTFSILYAPALTKDSDTDTFWTTVSTLDTGGTWS